MNHAFAGGGPTQAPRSREEEEALRNIVAMSQGQMAPGPQQQVPQLFNFNQQAPQQQAPQQQAPGALSTNFQAGPGALSQESMQQQAPMFNMSNIGTNMQNAGAYLMAINNPGALSLVAANNKIRDDKTKSKFSTFHGRDGKTYIMDTATGKANPIEGGTAPYPTTPGEIKVDQDYAKDQVDWINGGEAAAIEGNLRKLEFANNNLKSSDNISGPIAGLRNMLPDSVNSMLGGAKSIATRESVEDVITQSLRQILGSQFTNDEGKRLMARAYNPSLEESENIRRIGLLKTKITQMAQDKQATSDYYKQNGTLKGYAGRAPTLADIQAFDLEPQKQQTQQQAPAQGGSRPPLSSFSR